MARTTEDRLARLAADGLSNREIARQRALPEGGARPAPSHPAPKGEVLGWWLMVDFPDVAGTVV